MTDVAAPGRARVGPLLRDWQRRRRLSQLDLALQAGVSARQLAAVVALFADLQLLGLRRAATGAAAPAAS